MNERLRSKSKSISNLAEDMSDAKAAPVVIDEDLLMQKFQLLIKEALNEEDNLKTMKKIMVKHTNELMKEVAHLRNLLMERDQKIDALTKNIEDMEIKYDELEQYSRRNSMRIEGIPETQGEDPYEVVVKLANETLNVDPPLSADDIDRTHRVGRREEGKTRPLLVKMATYRKRQVMMSKRTTLHSRSGPKVFLNDDLTRRRAKLLWHARKMKSDGTINGCWSADGKILIKNQRNQIVAISTLADLGKAAAGTLGRSETSADGPR